MLGRRVLTTIVFVPILLVGLLSETLGEIVITMVVACSSVWGLYEFFKLARRMGAEPPDYWIYLSAFIYPIWVLNCCLDSEEGVLPGTLGLLFFITILGIFVLHVLKGRIEKTWESLMASTLGLSYVALPLLLGQMMYFGKHGAWLLFFVILTTWLSDTGAYLGGKMLGRHKLCPSISPGKTWEGVISGWALAMAGIFLTGLIQQAIFKPGEHDLFWMNGSLYGYFHLLTLGSILVFTGTFGDLMESMLKRQLQVKDSGSSLTGHGGFLDITDSLLINLPLMFLYAELCPLA